MTWAERNAAVQGLGYTEREASFLVTVALHSGYFLMRQFSVTNGKVSDRLAKKLAFYGHAAVTKCANKTLLFHLQAKAVYRALDQENNRHRRLHNPYHVRSKVMGLDYVLHHPQYRFLPTEEDKMSYFIGERSLTQRLLPAKTYAGKASNTERFFIDKYPIRVDPNTGRVAFCFVDDGAFGGLGFETWLSQYNELLRAIGTDAEVVYLSPDQPTFETARRQFTQQFSGVAGRSSDELKAYFELRREYEQATPQSRSKAAIDILRRLRKTFTGDSFESQYSRWIAHGFEPTSDGPRVAFTTHHLRFSYRFFGVKA